MDMYSENKADGSLPTEACQTKDNGGMTDFFRPGSLPASLPGVISSFF